MLYRVVLQQHVATQSLTIDPSILKAVLSLDRIEAAEHGIKNKQKQSPTRRNSCAIYNTMRDEICIK